MPVLTTEYARHESTILSVFLWQNNLSREKLYRHVIMTGEKDEIWLLKREIWGVRPVTEWMDGNA